MGFLGTWRRGYYESEAKGLKCVLLIVKFIYFLMGFVVVVGEGITKHDAYEGRFVQTYRGWVKLGAFDGLLD